MARYRAESLNPLASRPVVYALWVGILLTLALAIVSCDEGAVMTYVNTTDETLQVSVDGLLVHTLTAGETRESGIIRFSLPKLFEAKHQDGTVVFSETLTWEDLKQRGWKIVITEDMLSPTPTEAR